MFQDLVEADIFYAAIWNDKRTKRFQIDFLSGEKNLFPKICPGKTELSDMIFVAETKSLYYWNDVISGWSLCGISEGNDKKDQ